MLCHKVALLVPDWSLPDPGVSPSVCPLTLPSVHLCVKHLLICVSHVRPGLEDSVISGYSAIQQTIIKHLQCARPGLGSRNLVGTHSPVGRHTWDHQGHVKTIASLRRFAIAGPSLHEKILQMVFYS